MTEYDIVDTRVCLDDTRTTSVRMNVTVNAAKRHAVQWLTNSLRITDFSGSREQCLRINSFVNGVVRGDGTLQEEMNSFIEPYTV